MFQCDYTNKTTFRFNSRLKNQCTGINSSGGCLQNNIERTLGCSNVIGNEWVQFFISEIVDVPVEKPDIEEIVGVNSCVEIISQKVIRTPQVTGFTLPNGTVVPGQSIPNAECTNLTGKKLIIEGFLKEKVLYTALNTTQSLHSASFSVPFSVFIVVSADTPLNACFKITPIVEDVFACHLSERSIFKNTTIFINAAC